MKDDMRKEICIYIYIYEYEFSPRASAFLSNEILGETEKTKS